MLFRPIPFQLTPFLKINGRVHEYEYLSHLEMKCRDAAKSVLKYEDAATPVHFKTSDDYDNAGHQQYQQVKVRQEQQQIPSFYAPPGNLDVDTPLVPQSLEASRKFCGYVICFIGKFFQLLISYIFRLEIQSLVVC